MNQVTTTENKIPALNTIGLGIGLEDLIFEDYKQTYFSLLHPNSKALATNDNFKAGQIVNTETGEIVGGKGKPIDLFFCNWGRFWYQSDITKPNDMPTKFPMTAQNSILPRLDGNIKRVPGYEMYGFTRGTKNGFPVILSFRGSSADAAKVILTFLGKNDMNIYSHGFLVDSISKQNKSGQNYWLLTAKPSTPCTEEEQKIAHTWKSKIDHIKINAAEAAQVTQDISGDADEKTPF